MTEVEVLNVVVIPFAFTQINERATTCVLYLRDRQRVDGEIRRLTL